MSAPLTRLPVQIRPRDHRDRDKAQRFLIRMFGHRHTIWLLNMAKLGQHLTGINPEDILPTGVLVGNSPRAIIELAIAGEVYAGRGQSIPDPKHPILRPQLPGILAPPHA